MKRLFEEEVCVQCGCYAEPILMYIDYGIVSVNKRGMIIDEPKMLVTCRRCGFERLEEPAQGSAPVVPAWES